MTSFSGPDLKLIELASFVSVPVIVVGGISSLEDMSMAFEAGADAIAAGLFVFYGPHRAVLITYPKSDELLNFQLLNAKNEDICAKHHIEISNMQQMYHGYIYQ